MIRLCLACLWVICLSATAIEASGPRKEPTYQTKTPRYALLALGRTGADRVWLAFDGDVLYVDRNGNGDLTEPGEKVAPTKPREGSGDQGHDEFQIGDIKINGRLHKGLTVYVTPLSRYKDLNLGPHINIAKMLQEDPKATVIQVVAHIEVMGVKGGGLGGRLTFNAGFHDEKGLLQFAESPDSASTIRLGGPLDLSFYGRPASVRVGRSVDFSLAVGSPGVGPGTRAYLQYEGSIPESAKVQAEIMLPPAQPGGPTKSKTIILKDRC